MRKLEGVRKEPDLKQLKQGSTALNSLNTVQDLSQALIWSFSIDFNDGPGVGLSTCTGGSSVNVFPIQTFDFSCLTFPV